MTFHVPEVKRVTTGRLGTTRAEAGNNGLFMLLGPKGETLRCIASDGTGWTSIGWELPAWEHVSISLVDRTPTWAEMAYVKGVFWDEDDCVLQFHPPRADYRNFHEHCLHLWRPIGIEFPRPPADAVGPRGKG